MSSSLLFDAPRTYAYWWLCVPVLPASRADHRYAVLRRLWADQTMNCLRRDDTGWRLASSRGFYVEPREDHITPALFEVWAALPNVLWASSLLDLWRIDHGSIKRVNWSYAWEQKATPSERPDITDIVLCWEDDHGTAVLVIEAKRAGGKLSAKDLTGGARYLNMPSIRPFARKSVAFLVAEQDVASATRSLPPGTPIASWEDIGRLQLKALQHLELGSAIGDVCTALIRHYEYLGFSLRPSSQLADAPFFDGSPARYSAIRARGLPDPVERFMLASEVRFCARSGRRPHPPFEWLLDEPGFVDISASPQPTTERERALWRLSA